MIVRALQLDQFKKFDQPVVIEAFSDGLNLIAGPNEMGKSTLLLALRAALFERHGSRSQAIKALQPNHIQGAAPSVTVDLELGDGIYRIEKRFLRRPLARLIEPNGRIMEGSDAESEIRKLLRLEPDHALPLDKGSPAHFGVMLTPQSQSFHQPTLAQSTRHTLEEAITTEIEQLGNQSEVDAVLANIEGTTLEIVDKRNKPKARYKDVEARIADLKSEIDALEIDREALASDIEALNEAERTLRSLENNEAEDDLKATLDDLEKKRANLVRRKEIEARLASAKLRLERLLMKRDQRKKTQAEKANLVAVLDQLQPEEAELGAKLAEQEAELKDHDAKRGALIDDEDAIRQKKRSLEQLNMELKQRAEIEGALLSIATEVTIDLDNSALDRVQLDGRFMDQTREVVQVVDGLEIEIREVGRIRVLPKIDQLERLRERVAELDRSIADLTDHLDLQTIEPASVEVLWRDTEEEAETLAMNRADLDGIMKDLELVVEEKRHAVLALRARRHQAEERLAAIEAEGGHDDDDDDQIDEQLAKAEADLAAVQSLEEETVIVAKSTTLEPSALALDGIESDIGSIRQKIDRRARDIGEAKLKIERLGARVAVRVGRGLDERIDECRRRLDVLEVEQARFQLDVKALSLLKETLTEAANDAKTHFYVPLAAKLTPYLQALLPDAEIEVTPDFGITALHRGQPTAERFEQLSDGTREQIAILARLAFARMLQEQGLPSLVVLDDALVFSDQQRLDRMFQILENAAETMQIIILTCREDRFHDLNAKRLHIEQRAAAA